MLGSTTYKHPLLKFSIVYSRQSLYNWPLFPKKSRKYFNFNLIFYRSIFKKKTDEISKIQTNMLENGYMFPSTFQGVAIRSSINSAIKERHVREGHTYSNRYWRVSTRFHFVSIIRVHAVTRALIKRELKCRPVHCKYVVAHHTTPLHPPNSITVYFVLR